MVGTKPIRFPAARAPAISARVSAMVLAIFIAALLVDVVHHMMSRRAIIASIIEKAMERAGK